MEPAEVEWDDVVRLARSGGAEPWSHTAGEVPVLVVDLDGEDRGDRVETSPLVLSGAHVVVVGRTGDPAAGRAAAPELCDLVVASDAELANVVHTVTQHPVASMTLVELLRCAPGLDTAAGLLAESASYGVLQAGAEFGRWRAKRARRPVRAQAEPLLAARVGDELHLTLHRPASRNALDASLRDALVEQLHLAVLDPSIDRIVLDGSGSDFCSGGDLDEFGTADDVSLAHLIRLERSIARLLDAVAERLEVRVHGACIGSGVELAAFASSVRATGEVSIGLPEVGMGLIPGAGGTVSLPRRIGRHRTCWLALSGERLDTRTASDWGLLDGTDLSTRTGGADTLPPV